MMMRGLLLVFLLIGPVGAAYPQNASFLVEADTIRIGEPSRAALVVEYPSHLDVVLPDASSDAPATLGDFELRSLVDRSRHETYGGTIYDTLYFDVVSFALDTARVEGGVIGFEGPEDTVQVAVTGAWVPVAATYQEGQEPRDLAPIVDIPPSLWPWAVAALATLIAVALLMRWLRRRRSAEAAGEPRAAESPIDEARRRLRALSELPVREPADQKEYAIELVDLLRTYLLRRAGLPAFERTTGEIMRELRHSDLKTTHLESVRDTLTLSDRIKFARAEATETMLEETREVAGRWIEEVERTLYTVSSSEEPSHSSESP